MSTTDPDVDQTDPVADRADADTDRTDPDTDRIDREERLRELPPSAKLVYKVLEYDDSLTQGGLAEETLLPTRTVRYALTRLEEAGLVDSRFSFTDARTRLYSLRAEETTSGVLSEPL